MATILCVATLDTKGIEANFVKELIEKRGHRALLMDISCLEKSPYSADITAEDVAEAGDSSIEEITRFREAGPAAEVMTRGAAKIARNLYDSGKFQGVIAIGGGMGSSMASAVMRELPTGLPKFMLASQKIVQAGIRGYVGTKDIAVMPSVADIAGLNFLTRKALSNSVGAIIGMVESPEVQITERPLAFMTMLGPTTQCGLKIKSLLEERGFEVVIFHTVGIGGMTYEELVQTYPVRGVIELGLNEIGNELFGGMATAGPSRLEGAGKKGIPQIITPGNIEYINFLTPDSVPIKYKSRNLHSHNPQATLLRLNGEELRMVGETVGMKIRKASGPVKVIIPTQGFSSLSQKGSVFFDPEADKVFTDSLISSLNRTDIVRTIDAHINDVKFAKAVFDEFVDLMEKSRP